MQILIVDDRDDNLYLLEVLLKGNGHEVHSVSNGAEALKVLESGGIELVISDILMPVMDGFELCRKVRADERMSGIPFIIYTATYTGPQDETFALKIGADRFIQKPCEPEVLMEAVRGVMLTAKNRNMQLKPEQPPEEEVLKLYNERLVRKLEHKMMELEKEVQSRQKTEEILRQSEKKYRLLYNSIRDAIVVSDTNRKIIDCNRAFLDLFGYSSEEITEKEVGTIYENESEFIRLINTLKQRPGDACFLYPSSFIKKNGDVFPGEVNVFHLLDDEGTVNGLIGLIRDITERKRAEKTEKELEMRLHQAQKMEAVGRLAGGIAHDFNNMLSIIIGYADMAMCHLNPLEPLYQEIAQIKKAGERSADLTSQLLAFSRKQPTIPVVTNLNSTIESRLRMLGKLIGEDINVKFFPADDLWNIRMDNSQLDQIIVNLAVNARDAISGVGTITIETTNTSYDDKDVMAHTYLAPGEYVVLSVADTGKGMDGDTMEHIFEPFFSTKGEAGTGLGLATVYGIVKQNEGTINVYSEPEIGTTFRIYLPRFYGEAEERIVKTKSSAGLEGKETILVVEDEELVLSLVRRILESYGYKVISAKTPGDACLMAETLDGKIDLFLSDMIMPGMSGIDLHKKIQMIRPGLKTIFMSGYTQQFIAHQKIIEEGHGFIQKPFSVMDLAQKVREILDQQI